MPIIGIKNYQQIIERAKGQAASRKYKQGILTTTQSQAGSKGGLLPACSKSEFEYLDYPKTESETDFLPQNLQSRGHATNSIALEKKKLE